MSKSSIEWTQETWNPITGCTKHSEGCKNCYAEKMHKRLKGMGSAKYQHEFNKVVCHPEELNRDFGKKPKMIFVNSMSDIFHEDVPREFIYETFWAAARQGKHIFQFLTKRPYKNKPNEFATLPHMPNIWFGITVENQEAKKRLDVLKESARFNVQFLSCEPLLEDLGELDLSNIDWVIVGGESGPNARPIHPDWVYNIKKQCQEQGVPFFFKQWGEWLPEKYTRFVNLENKKVGAGELLNFDGSLANWDDFRENQCLVYKVGKKIAGSLLNGVEYKEYPKAVQA